MLTALQRYDLHLKISKCSFNAMKVNFLGFKINTEGIYMNLKRIQAVKEWLPSENVHEIQVFLGFVNFFWRFIKNYSRIATPLLNLLKTERNKKKTDIALTSQTSWMSQQKSLQKGEQKSSTLLQRSSSDYSAHSSQIEELQATCSSQVREELWQENVVPSPFSLSEAALRAFNALKETFTSASLLHYFNKTNSWGLR